MPCNRRQFVRIVPALGAFTISAADAAVPAAPAEDSAEYAWPPPFGAGEPYAESFPSLHAFLAKEMVTVSHGNLARVKELVARHASLAKASWDWGFGDWETALGAASHVGNRPIAEFLLENGAAPTIFSAAMLGQLDVVKAYAAAMPDIHQLRGPHGIPLAAHAQAGGPAAAPVLALVQSLGAVPAAGREPLSETDRAAIEGRYVFGSRPRDVFVVDTERDQLGITRLGAARRNLFHKGSLEFYPTGAPAVRIQFQRNQNPVTISVFDPDLVARAVKA
jgi:hypothetical protein